MIMNSGGSTTPCFSDATTAATSSQQIYNPRGGTTATATATAGTSLEEDDVVSSSLLYNLSILQEKIHEIESFVSDHVFISHQNNSNINHHSSTSLTMANIGTLVQEIITAATSMLFTCQQLHIKSNNNNCNNSRHSNGDDNIESTVIEFFRQETDPDHNYFLRDDDDFVQARGQITFSNNQITQNLECTNVVKSTLSSSSSDKIIIGETTTLSTKNYDIVELNAADLLAKYTHYCQICGKGFRRDANLRMHMRAHGDEYKTTEALINPMNRRRDNSTAPAIVQNKKMIKHYYSCPHEGCRWNQRHEKFQPLKSIICVKNHYKRSHCPKLYVCKRCNVKQFSVLSDLRTHEKHCGDVKWVCSCGTSFSRKDKLMSHVALFVGHAPAEPAAKHGQVRAGN